MWEKEYTEKSTAIKAVSTGSSKIGSASGELLECEAFCVQASAVDATNLAAEIPREEAPQTKTCLPLSLNRAHHSQGWWRTQSDTYLSLHVNLAHMLRYEWLSTIHQCLLLIIETQSGIS